MDKVFTGMLCLSKIDESRLQTSDETWQTWMKVGIVLLEKPDKFGNNIVIQHRGTKGQDHIIIGNAVKKGEIKFEFPHPNHSGVPSKIDTRCECDETYRDYNN